MALPSSRSTTYAAGSQVKSADLNAMQDSIAGLHHGNVTQLYSAMSVSSGSGGGIAVNNGRVQVANGAGPYYLPLNVREGDRIRSYEPVYNRTSSVVTVRLRRIATDGTVTTIDTFTDNTNTGWRKGASATLDHAVVADSTYYFVLETTAAAWELAGIHVIYDRPFP